MTQGSNHVSTAVSVPSRPPDPDIDVALGEQRHPDEQVLAEAIAAAVEGAVRRRYANGPVLRDAHPKAHGCLRADFRVADTLPPALGQGIFEPGARYPAWVRFSNGSADANRPDIKGDARGMAIKLSGLPGASLLGEVDGAWQGASQDFILISHPVFFVNDPLRYLRAISLASSGGPFNTLRIPFSLGLRGAWIAWKTSRKVIANPLQARYWSTVPYALGSGLGRQAVKYSARPCPGVLDPLPRSPGPDFLRDALRTSLQGKGACMEFLVQVRTSSVMSVEDAMTEWSERDAPFQRVATLHFAQQDFDTPAQNEACERLSFNPWHALAEHRPLGLVNRLRRVIYERIRQVRGAPQGTGSARR